MALDDATRATLMAAGANAVEWNSPLGEDRAQELVGFVVSAEPATVLDLGCGRARLLHRIASADPSVRAIGVDTDAAVIAVARGEAAASDLSEHTELCVADAAGWTEPVDAALCVGASHAFGDAKAMFVRLGELVDSGVAVVGDGYWAGDPDEWCLDTFGPLPTSLDALADLARAAGWAIDDLDSSSTSEWDDFENAWIAGVRAQGTPAAEAFAARREAEYLRYRNVLGFTWLRLRR